MEYFKIITKNGEYEATKKDEKEPFIVDIKFTSGVEATYIFKSHANTAVAQQIFNIDKHAF